MDKLEHLHNVLLVIMDEIDRVCKKNDIKYTITGGSMLGAVRHAGFIPWDDDMDVALTRDNYNKLIASSNDFDSHFFLQTNQTDSDFNYGYAKLLLKGTTTIEFGHERTKYKKGIFVDIFPLDVVPSSINLQNKHSKTNYVLQKLLRQKMKVADNDLWGIKKRLLFRIVDFSNLFTSRDVLVKKMNANMSLYRESDGEYITNLCGLYGYNRESIPRSWFNEYETIQFENRNYSVIKEYDKFLTKLYGNYMKLPPIEKRHTHEFLKLDFGEY